MLREPSSARQALTMLRLSQAGLPAYFVNAEFAEAVIQTRPPPATLVADIKAPLQDILFALPEAWSRKVFGAWVQLITLSWVNGGGEKLSLAHSQISVVNENQADMLVGSVWGQDEDASTFQLPLHYSYEASASEALLEKYEGGMKDEATRLHKVMLFSLQLLLVMNTRTDLRITEGSVQRPERQRKGKHEDALWSPAWIGKDYQAQRGQEKQSEEGGAVRMHWRRGHLHTVLHGPAKSLSRVDWFEPVLVNAE